MVNECAKTLKDLFIELQGECYKLIPRSEMPKLDFLSIALDKQEDQNENVLAPYLISKIKQIYDYKGFIVSA